MSNINKWNTWNTWWIYYLSDRQQNNKESLEAKEARIKAEALNLRLKILLKDIISIRTNIQNPWFRRFKNIIKEYLDKILDIFSKDQSTIKKDDFKKNLNDMLLKLWIDLINDIKPKTNEATWELEYDWNITVDEKDNYMKWNQITQWYWWTAVERITKLAKPNEKTWEESDFKDNEWLKTAISLFNFIKKLTGELDVNWKRNNESTDSRDLVETNDIHEISKWDSRRDINKIVTFLMLDHLNFSRIEKIEWSEEWLNFISAYKIYIKLKKRINDENIWITEREINRILSSDIDIRIIREIIKIESAQEKWKEKWDDFINAFKIYLDLKKIMDTENVKGEELMKLLNTPWIKTVLELIRKNTEKERDKNLLTILRIFFKLRTMYKLNEHGNIKGIIFTLENPEDKLQENLKRIKTNVLRIING